MNVRQTFPGWRSDEMVEAAVKAASADPKKRISWGRFKQIGLDLGVEEDTVDQTLFRAFDIFDLSIEIDGEILPEPDQFIAGCVRDGNPPGDALMFYRLKV